MPIPSMTHRKAGNAQVGLSYFFLAGFFICLILEGLGYFKVDVSNNLREMAMLVLSFWFMRQRTTGDEPEKKANPEQPSDPKVPSSP